MRIKSLKKEIKKELLDQKGYQTIFHEEDPIRYKEVPYINKINYENRKYELNEKVVVTYSARRAEKDKQDRERLIEKAENLLATPELIKSSMKRGGKKYLKETGLMHWTFDENAVARDQAFDGYYAIQTNILDLDVEKILNAYHTLWKIEESFRIMKSTLEIRPIFHWTPKRIKGHFMICFIAFLLERTLEFKLHENHIQASPRKIREAINKMQVAAMEFQEQKIFVKTKATELSSKLLKILRLKSIKNITAMTDFIL